MMGKLRELLGGRDAESDWDRPRTEEDQAEAKVRFNNVSLERLRFSDPESLKGALADLINIALESHEEVPERVDFTLRIAWPSLEAEGSTDDYCEDTDCV